jgi:hypothetical protein
MQIDYYKTFSESIIANPFELPLLQQSTLNELDQIVNKINQEDYYQSYLGEFGNSTEVINEYRNIISFLNYFEGNVKMYNTSLEKSFNFDYERKIGLKKLVEKSMDETAGFIVNKEVVQNYHAFWEFINQTLFDFHQLNPAQADLPFFYANFIEPLKNGLIPFTTTVPTAHYLIIQMKSATFIFNDIKLQNINVANDFESLHNQMNTFYEQLRLATVRIMEFNQ